MQINTLDLSKASENYEEQKNDLEETSLSLEKVDNINLSKEDQKTFEDEILPKEKISKLDLSSASENYEEHKKDLSEATI